MPPVPARAPIDRVSLGNGQQAERIVEFAIGQQAGIGSNTRPVELQLEAAAEIETEDIGLGFTRWRHRLRHRSNQTKR